MYKFVRLVAHVWKPISKCDNLMVINFVGLGWVCVGHGWAENLCYNWVELWGSTPSFCFGLGLFTLVLLWELGYILVCVFFVIHRIEIFICITFVHIYHVWKLKTFTFITCKKRSVTIYCNKLNFLLECTFFFVKKMKYVLLVFTQ
jgi:hypothetical protein